MTIIDVQDVGYIWFFLDKYPFTIDLFEKYPVAAVYDLKCSPEELLKEGGKLVAWEDLPEIAKLCVMATHESYLEGSVKGLLKDYSQK